ncbi:hypothetical protein [Spongiimicrobium salis]|uniref:hypothetical protein n=1 Tax=Spongiimicrobium salis TaxID=1667022 RepID=UPI00374D48D2
MKPKDKALLYNFFGFGLLFIVFRLALGSFLELQSIFLAIIAAIAASVIAPKFGVVKTEEGHKVMMKWIFMKGTKEV